MKLHSLIAMLVVLLSCSVCVAQSGSAETSQTTQQAAGSDAGDAAPALRRSNRMDFDGRLIKGEKAKGSVYLFQRAQRRLPPLLTLERDGINRIVYPVLRRNADPVSSAPVEGAIKAKGEAVPKAKASGDKAKPKKKTRKKKRWRRKRAPKKAPTK